MVIGQVAKQHQGRRVCGVIQRILQGSAAQVQALIQASQGGSQLNTAFIERLNATFRSRLASLGRRSRAMLRQTETLTPPVYPLGSVYNLCSDNESLRLKLWVGERGFRWVRRTPVLAAGITDHCRRIKELLLNRLAPPVGSPAHRGRPSAEEWELLAKWAL